MQCKCLAAANHVLTSHAMCILYRGLGCFETIWASSRKQLSYNSLKLLQNGLNFHSSERNAWRKQRKAFSSLQILNGKHVTGGPWWGAWSPRAAPVAYTRANIPRDLPTLCNVPIARTPENNSYDEFSRVLTIPASSCTPKLASSQAIWLVASSLKFLPDMFCMNCIPNKICYSVLMECKLRNIYPFWISVCRETS